MTGPVRLWDQLEDPNNPRAVKFMEIFNKFNKSIGSSLGQLREQPQAIQGRDREISMLYAILERPKTPVALLLGQAGVGKTALVEEFAKQLNSGAYKTSLDYEYLLVALRLGSLASLGNHKLQSTLATLLDDIKKFETLAQQALNKPNLRIVLFMDEVHMLVTIFGPGTKIGGDVIKDVLARSPIRVIAATTRREYDSTIAVDKPLSERFKQIEMDELPGEVIEDIALEWWSKVAPDCPTLDLELVRKIIDANAMYRSDSAEPRKSLDILEDLVSYCRRTGKKAEEHVVNDIFKRRYSINLKFEADADDVYAEIERRVKGQPFALFTMKRLLRTMMFQLDPTSNKPMATALFTGPTGVGKTETSKALNDSLYPDENVMLFINMPDYKTPEHEAGFRKRLGEYVRHTPNAIVLLDEFEKSHESIRDAMLTILDEGLISFETINREGTPEVNTVSLRNTIVIATTNAGSEVFANDAKFSQRGASGRDEYNAANASEIDQLMKALRPNLIENGFKPEMLGRFNRIVPFRGLSVDTLLTIAENTLKELFDKLEKMRGIKIHMNEPRQWPADTYDYVASDLALYIAFVKAKADDPNSGGARAVRREIDTAVYDAVIDAVMENPNSTEFKIQVSKDSSIYNPGAAPTEGGVEIRPLN